MQARLKEHWYAVFCKPRGEETAAVNLDNQGYMVYLPRLLTQCRRAGEWVERIGPLFPRYLFLKPRDAAQSLGPVRSTLGVMNLVRFGGQPALIPDNVVEALRARHDPASGVHVQRTAFRPGAAVQIVEGPLRGLEGIFSKETGDERVIVLLDLLGKINSIRVSRDWLTPVT